MALELYLVRHGQTDWALAGKHTGRSDIPLNETGRTQALALAQVLGKIDFARVLTSPLSRARETAKLCGLGERAEVVDDLAEFNYGDYDGLTSAQIRDRVPGWTFFTGDCPGGETFDDATKRAEDVLDLLKNTDGKVAIFSHGHMLRILTMAWLNMPARSGQMLMLDTTTLSILSHQYGAPSIKIWNAPLNLVALL